MSVQNEISRLEKAKAGIKSAIENKGVPVSNEATIDEYPEKINSIKNSVKLTELAHIKSESVHELTGFPSEETGLISCVFKATSAYATGDTFTVDGTSYTIQLSNGETAEDNLFVSGATVPIVLDTGAKKVNFKAAGGGLKFNPAYIQKTPLWGNEGFILYNPSVCAYDTNKKMLYADRYKIDMNTIDRTPEAFMSLPSGGSIKAFHTKSDKVFVWNNNTKMIEVYNISSGQKQEEKAVSEFVTVDSGQGWNIYTSGFFSRRLKNGFIITSYRSDNKNLCIAYVDYDLNLIWQKLDFAQPVEVSQYMQLNENMVYETSDRIGLVITGGSEITPYVLEFNKTNGDYIGFAKLEGWTSSYSTTNLVHTEEGYFYYAKRLGTSDGGESYTSTLICWNKDGSLVFSKTIPSSNYNMIAPYKSNYAIIPEFVYTYTSSNYDNGVMVLNAYDKNGNVVAKSTMEDGFNGGTGNLNFNQLTNSNTLICRYNNTYMNRTAYLISDYYTDTVKIFEQAVK